ncbi:MAG: replication initiator protein A [Endozoicomonadaceae bacterium]|nr:replication initiator protein A [Endozoicomonadaceae bacterium]
MAADKQRDLSPLLPERYPQLDFFVCDIFDATPKSDMASMEHPLFSLSTKPDYTRKEYTNGDSWIKIAPSPDGCATVHDRDVLIYCISQLMAAINDGRKVSRKLRFHANHMLTTTNRDTSGYGYVMLQNALRRLQGTQIETNITTGGKEEWRVFSFIESAEIIKESRDGRMQDLEITLSDWVFNAIQEKCGDLLTISRDYFRLRKPLERRLYEIARKHCGNKNKEWKFKIETLHKKTGSRSTMREFRRMLNNIIDKNNLHEHIPDYTFSLIDDTIHIFPRPDFRKIYNREHPTDIDKAIDDIRLKPNTYDNARKVATGWDIYGVLEQDWRRMLKDKQSLPIKPDGSFLNFVKWRVKQNGNPR